MNYKDNSSSKIGQSTTDSVDNKNTIMIFVNNFYNKK